jgi:hypothetical protein
VERLLLRVLIEPNSVKEPYEIEVKRRTSDPFGIFRGSHHGKEDGPGASFSLVHLTTRRIIATLSRQKDCTMLAAELMPLRSIGRRGTLRRPSRVHRMRSGSRRSFSYTGKLKE